MLEKASLTGDLHYITTLIRVFPWWAWWFILIPIFFESITVILLSQIFVQSFWDTNNAILGLCFSLASAWCFTVVIKMTFFEIFNWKYNSQQDHIYNVRKKVTGRPGLRTTIAFAGYVFIVLYLNAKLKIWTSSNNVLWKSLLVCIPLLQAIAIGWLETQEHQDYNCVAGAIIGALFAMAAYRMFYAGLFNEKVNHMSVPLLNSSSLHILLSCFHLSVWTFGCTARIALN